jgi:NAD(P)-dependent dehydrogenase (short-subunit alcohol dehydrogenase family)
MKDASSQAWFVTGSSRGLGRALTEAVLAAGHRVVATARKTADVNQFADHYGDRVKAVPLDVTQPEQALRAAKEAVAAFGRIDVLVNNAGYANIDCAVVSASAWLPGPARWVHSRNRLLVMPSTA